jgi:hypothetical protein
MTYLCIIFASPLYFLGRKNWGAFTLNATLYGLACLLLVTIIGAAFAPIFWALAVGHAGWHLRRELMTQHAELIASKMAERFQQMAGSPPRLQAAEYCTNCGASCNGLGGFCEGCGKAYASAI